MRKRREIVQWLHNAVTVDVLANSKPRPIADVPGLAIRNAEGEREIMIYGAIGRGGWFSEAISASDIAAALKELGPGHIDVRLNSGGGDVFEGVAIHTQFARHSGGVTIHVDGLAASAASFIAMAGDRIVMARNAFMMIHDGMTMTYGNPKTHEDTAELLHKVSDNIADMYAERAGEDAAYWRNLMSERGEDGTWYTGQEALDAGLVDEITTGKDVEDRTTRNLQGWTAKLPQEIRATLEDPEAEASTSEPETTPESGGAPNLDDEEDFRFAMEMAHWQITKGRLTARED